MRLMVSSCLTWIGQQQQWWDRKSSKSQGRRDFTHFPSCVNFGSCWFSSWISTLLVDGVVLRYPPLRSRFTLGSEKSPKALGETPGEIVDSSRWEFKVGNVGRGLSRKRGGTRGHDWQLRLAVGFCPTSETYPKIMTGWLAGEVGQSQY